VLGVYQEQRQSFLASGTDGQAHCTGCDPHALKLEDRIEACDAGPESDEDDHGESRALVHVLEQPVEGEGQEDSDCLIQQVGDDADPDKSGVRD
jgi:hypothetical protein